MSSAVAREVGCSRVASSHRQLRIAQPVFRDRVARGRYLIDRRRRFDPGGTDDIRQGAGSVGSQARCGRVPGAVSTVARSVCEALDRCGELLVVGGDREPYVGVAAVGRCECSPGGDSDTGTGCGAEEDVNVVEIGTDP